MFLGLTLILFNFAHHSGSPDLTDRRELLGTDSAQDRCQYARMKKKREPKAPAKTTIAGIKKEMQRPRLAGSVRDDSSYQVVLATERPTRLAVKEAERLPMFSVEVV
jgi:hypothetical protein